MGVTASDEVRQRVLDAVRTCCERWGIERTTVDDIARESGVSRATLYRLFPGGKEVLFAQHREREIADLLGRILVAVDGVDDLHRLVATLVSAATRELRADEHLALMLASEPGEVAAEFTIGGLSETIAVTGAFLSPLLDAHLESDQAQLIVDVFVRMVLSYFLAPSDHIDLADEAQALAFVTPFIDAVRNRTLNGAVTNTSTGVLT